MTEGEFRQRLKFLEDEFGYRLARFRVDRQAFGNIVAEYERPGSGVLVVIDRGIPEIQVTVGDRTLYLDQAREEAGLPPVSGIVYKDRFDCHSTAFGVSLDEQAAGLRTLMRGLLR